MDWMDYGGYSGRKKRPTRRVGREDATPQLGLFAEPQPTAPFVPFSDTSREAARRIEPVTGTLRLLVFRSILDSPHGRTDDEIEVLLDMRHQTASARRRELVQQGKVKDSGLTRKTRSGTPATVWVVTEGL
jgi:hypothetical protein